MTRSKHQRRQQREKKKQRYVPDVIQTYAKDKSSKPRYRTPGVLVFYADAEANQIHQLATEVFGQSGYIPFEVYSSP